MSKSQNMQVSAADNTFEVFAERIRKTSATWRGLDRRTASVQYDVAVLTIELVDAGYLGKKGEEGVQVSLGDYAKKFDRSASWTTLMVRLGRASQKGISPADKDTKDLWTVLSSKANAKVVAEALENEKATVEDVRAAVEKAGTTNKNKKASTESGQSGDDPSLTRVTEGNIHIAVEQIVATAAGFIGKVSGEQLLALEVSAQALLDAVQAEMGKDQKVREQERMAV